ncbi:hypothetical protein [uncultured Eubacterium sp.]|uniref:hypothetical protein n=1 Tax=uncultured Eubacterium sp. TaxID=165185 RepID=UPI0015BF3E47|nr:hypothetical protein [uncultured Eubacterium sp.]
MNVDTTYFDATDWFKGTYSFNSDKSELTLNVDYTTYQYSGTVNFVASVYTTFTFDFS